MTTAIKSEPRAPFLPPLTKEKKPAKVFPQTDRQKEIEKMARAFVTMNPHACLADIARWIGIDPARLHRLIKRKRVVVEIPATEALRAKRAQKALDGTRTGVRR